MAIIDRHAGLVTRTYNFFTLSTHLADGPLKADGRG